MKKFNYVYVLQGNYGYGWDDISEENKAGEVFDTGKVTDKGRRIISTPLKRIKEDLRDYLENDKKGRFRIISRRVKVA